MAAPDVIGIDASRVSIGQRTGTETYTYQLLRVLARLPIEEPFRLYLNAPSPPADLPPLGRAIPMPFPRLWTHVRLSWEMVRRPPGVLFVPAHVIPLLHPRSVVTIHDLGYLHEPEAHPPAQRRMLDWTTRWSCGAARRVIAVSEATKRDLLDYYRVPAQRIVVIPHGIEPMTPPADEVQSVRNAHALPERFVLAVGTIQPRKNLGRLAKAMSRIAQSGLPHHLLIAGKRGWLADQVEQEIERSGASARIRLLGYVATDELPALYAAADAVCFPSLYEGFGLPALEAMAAGTPLLISDRGALPEVAGNAALIVDPLDIAAIAHGLIRLLTDTDLRTRLIARGRRRVAAFTWDQTARQTLAVLRAVRDE